MSINRLLFLIFAGLAYFCSDAFAPAMNPTSARQHQRQGAHLQAKVDGDGSNDRRQFLMSAASVAVTGAASLLSGEPAAATYSAYTHREDDWKQRQSSGQVTYSTAKQLRSQLREIVPQNDDSRSKIFCPNGPSAAVSPLMENKCGDRVAMPSVYGRTTDAVGNSIPGFAGGFYTSTADERGDALAMPEYGFTSNSKKGK